MYISARISRTIFIGPVLPRSRIITRHLLRHNTYFNWGLRAAAHTMHQSRRFIRNSSLPARHPLSLSPRLARFFSSSLSRSTCLWSREYRNMYNTTIWGSLTRILETKRKVRALISRSHCDLRDAKLQSHTENYGIINCRVSLETIFRIWSSNGFGIRQKGAKSLTDIWPKSWTFSLNYVTNVFIDQLHKSILITYINAHVYI